MRNVTAAGAASACWHHGSGVKHAHRMRGKQHQMGIDVNKHQSSGMKIGAA